MLLFWLPRRRERGGKKRELNRVTKNINVEADEMEWIRHRDAHFLEGQIRPLSTQRAESNKYKNYWMLNSSSLLWLATRRCGADGLPGGIYIRKERAPTLIRLLKINVTFELMYQVSSLCAHHHWVMLEAQTVINKLLSRLWKLKWARDNMTHTGPESWCFLQTLFNFVFGESGVIFLHYHDNFTSN